MSRALRLGVFIVAGLVVFTGAIFLIGGRRMIFTPAWSLNADFTDAAGLAPGADVRVAGIREGTVKRIDLPRQADQKVRIEMTLDDATRNVIRKDSTAAIRTQGLMGDEYVEISFGSMNARKVGNGDTINGQTPVEIADLVRKANGILDTANAALGNVDATAGNMKSITSKINQGSGTIGALLNDKQIYQNVEQTSEEAKEDMEAAKHNFLLSHFFHKRGYEDAADLTKNEIPKLPAGVQAMKVFSYDPKKIFDKADTAKLRENKALNQAGAYLQSAPYGLAVAAASTDMGDTDQDRVLTEARAMVVRNYLVDHFKLDDTKIKTIGLGKSAALPDGAGVAILVYPPGTTVETPGERPADGKVASKR